MEQWWKWNSKVALGSYEKAEIEDFTGCIPLLLDKCVVDGKINLEAKAFKEIYREAQGFVRNIKTNSKPSDWNWYVELVQPPGHG
jgi:hypothetical protein